PRSGTPARRRCPVPGTARTRRARSRPSPRRGRRRGGCGGPSRPPPPPAAWRRASPPEPGRFRHLAGSTAAERAPDRRRRGRERYGDVCWCDCGRGTCPQRRKCFTLSKRSRTIVTDLDPRVRFLSPNQGGTIPAGGSRRPCAATAAGPTATPAPLVAAGALPRPRPVPYRSDRRRRERRVLHARDVLDDPDDLAGVAELVVVPEVEDRVVALDLQGARVHDRRVAR